MPNATSWRTVVEKSCASKSCDTSATRPARSDTVAAATSSPSTSMAPVRLPGWNCGMLRLMHFARVDFPAPVAPMTTTISPRCTRSEMRRNAGAPAPR